MVDNDTNLRDTNMIDKEIGYTDIVDAYMTEDTSILKPAEDVQLMENTEEEDIIIVQGQKEAVQFSSNVEHLAASSGVNGITYCDNCGKRFYLKSNHEVHTLFCKAAISHQDANKDVIDFFNYVKLSDEGLLKDCVSCNAREKIKHKVTLTDVSNLLFNYHLKMDSDSIQVSMCSECGRDFLYKHSILMEKEPTDVVEKKTNQNNEHEKLEKPFKCCICSRRFLTMNESLEHEVKHVSSLTRYSCASCNTKFVTRDELQNHYDNSNTCEPNRCNICNRVFIHSSHFKRHLTIHAGLKPYTCKICRRGFNQRSDLQRHQKVHLTDDGAYACTTCSFCCDTIEQIAIHINSNHQNVLNDSKNGFTCEKCGKIFGRKSHLKRHLKIHEGLRPFSCEYCRKCFTQRADLNRHIATHKRKLKTEDLTSNECALCNRAFTTQHQFIEHFLAEHKVAIESVS